MDKCDLRDYILNPASIFRFIFDSLGLTGSLFLLIVILKTSTLKGFSGVLLLNEQFTCLLEQILSIVLNLTLQLYENPPMTFLLSAIQTVKSVSLLLLLAINVILYLAIQKGVGFRTLITWKRIVIVIVIFWLTSAPLGMTPLFMEDYFVFDCDALYPFPNRSSFWRLLIYLVICGIGLLINGILLFKIIKRKRTHQPNKNLMAFTETQKKFKLTMFIFIITIIYTITYTSLYAVWYSKITFTRLGLPVGPLFNTVTYLNKAFVNLRVFYYLPLYRPLWLTARALLNPCSVHRKVHPVIARLTVPANLDGARLTVPAHLDGARLTMPAHLDGASRCVDLISNQDGVTRQPLSSGERTDIGSPESFGGVYM